MIIGGDTECSYFYVGRLSIGDMLGVADAGRFVIAYEKNPGHTDYGYYYRNALCLDGHIEELDPEWMSDSLEKVKAMDAWPDLPEERKQEIEAFYTLEQTE